MDLAANITTLHFRNLMDALMEPACLTSFPRLRTLHIQQDTHWVFHFYFYYLITHYTIRLLLCRY